MTKINKNVIIFYLGYDLEYVSLDTIFLQTWPDIFYYESINISENIRNVYNV